MTDKSNGLIDTILTFSSTQEGLDDLLAMCEHRSGYRRENAVRRLGMLGNAIAIPRLIVRANDWVPQVREAARGAIVRLCRHENASAIVASLPALYHLRNCARDDHETLLSNVVDFLLLEENIGYLKAAIRNENHFVARIAVNLCDEKQIVDRRELVSACLAHSDVVVRNWASSHLRDFDGKVLADFLAVAIKDPFMPIRREAFQIYLRVLPDQGSVIAEQFLFDRNSSIREIAIKCLRANGVDVEAILSPLLRSHVTAIGRIRCAILGLAEIGAKASIPTITEFLGSPHPSIRKAALQALATLAAIDVRVLLIERLQDSAPCVVKESSRILQVLGARLTAAELLTVLQSTQALHTWLSCIRLAQHANKWEQLTFLLAAHRLPNVDDGRTGVLGDALLQWDREFNRRSGQPTLSQIEGLRLEFGKVLSLLNERQRKSLAFTLRTCGIDV